MVVVRSMDNLQHGIDDTKSSLQIDLRSSQVFLPVFVFFLFLYS